MLLKVLVVIPGRRPGAGPGIQMQPLNLFLDSGFAAWRPRPGMTILSGLV
jgi:hypothetical protein